MQTARRRFLRTLLFGRFPPPPSPASSSIATLVRGSLDISLPCATLAAPWSALQSRGAKVLGTDVIEAKSLVPPFATALKCVFGIVFTFTFFHHRYLKHNIHNTEGEEPQYRLPEAPSSHVSVKVIGVQAEDMTVRLQYYDGKIMSASVPHRVKCKVVEAQPNVKGLTAAPQ
ncbi:hypothetical protein BHM03_00006223 [Ensete ventricosum]|uniref:Uncharacterized protein n=1 Tax=Ensete ventricosum TaxID=4639 RepID=A0A445MBL8_ENSVE|nr:hypothetical protein BHM03_00006223 [Ensete ventricosum]